MHLAPGWVTDSAKKNNDDDDDDEGKDASKSKLNFIEIVKINFNHFKFLIIKEADSVDHGHDEEEDEEDVRDINFEPQIPQPQSSQLSMSTLDKTVVNSKNLIIQYEADIEKLQKGSNFNNLTKEGIAAEEKRKVNK